MAKRATLTSVQSKVHYSEPVLTGNFNALNENFDNYLHLGGTTESGNSMSGNLDMNSKRVVNVPTPSGSLDAANKAYVDSVMSDVASGTTINTALEDADNDTGIDTEATTDVDRLDLFAASSGGQENAIEITGDDSSAASLNNPYVKVLKHVVMDTDVRIQDAVSGNTYMELSDSTDADHILFVGGGTSLLTLDGVSDQIQTLVNIVPAVGKGVFDADEDTGIQVEESSDEDIIRFDVGGTEVLVLDYNAGSPTYTLKSDITMYSNSATAVGKKIGDEDLDTYLQFNQATGGTDDDTIRMYAGGVEVVNIDSTGLTLNAGTFTFNNLSVTGTLNVDGATTLNGDVTVDGDVTLGDASGDTITFTGTPSLPGAVWPSFSVYLSSDFSVSTSSTTKIEWDSEDFDTNNNFDSTTNYRFTPTVTGKYILTISVELTGVDTGQFSIVYLYKNGSQLHRIAEPSGVASRHHTASFIVDADGSSDYFEVYVDAGSDSSYIIEGTSIFSRFTGCRIG